MCQEPAKKPEVVQDRLKPRQKNNNKTVGIQGLGGGSRHAEGRTSEGPGSFSAPASLSEVLRMSVRSSRDSLVWHTGFCRVSGAEEGVRVRSYVSRGRGAGKPSHLAD